MLEDLHCYVNPNQDDWDEWLPLAEFAYNHYVHEAVGTTPFYLNYGRHPKLPTSPVKNAAFPAVTEFVSHNQEVIKQAKSKLEKARQRAKHYSDTKMDTKLMYKVGEQVLLST